MKKSLVLSVLLVVLGSCNISDIDCDMVDDTVDNSGLSVDAVEGQAIVKFDDGLVELIEEDIEAGEMHTKSDNVNSLVELLGIKSIERLFPDAGKFEKRTREAGLHKWYKITYDPSVTYTKASSELEAVAGIDVVEPVCNINTRQVFTDPYFTRQWGYYNDGTLSSFHSRSVDINVTDAWKAGEVGNKEVIVAVIDGGIDQTHEDLASNCIGGYNFIRRNTNITPHNHGTHVAGTIAAVNNNAKGVCGIAGGDADKGISGVSLLSCQIFEHDPRNPNEDLTADGAEAIKWAADNGAVIAQNSWGYLFESYYQAKKTTISKSLKEAIDYFIEYAGVDENGHQVGPMKGGVVIFAAGNDGWDTDPIGKYDPVISVASITSYGTRADYSNYGDWVDIAAPGGSFERDECYILSTLPGNSYGYMNGTSMACPHVSGAAALIVSKYGGQGFTPEELKKRLLQGADYSALPKKYEVGPLLDVYSSLSELPDFTPDRVNGISISEGKTSVELQWIVSANDDGIVPASYCVYLSGRSDVLDGLDVTKVPSDVLVKEVGTEDRKDGDKMICRVSSLDYDTSYEVGIVAFGHNGESSPMSEVYRFTTGGNNAPVLKIKEEVDVPVVVGAHSTVKVLYEVDDPENHKIYVSVRGGDKGLSYSYDESAGYLEISLKGDGANPGEYVAEIVAIDALGAQCSMLLNYQLAENLVPVLVRNENDMVVSDISVPIEMDLSQYFEDPDGGRLAFDVSLSDDQIMYYDLENGGLTLYPLRYGVSEVSVRAGDIYGYSETMTFRVLARNGKTPIVLYPNPVQDYLNIRVIEEDVYTIDIYAPGGTLLRRVEKQITPFDDLKFDMSDYAPGNYAVSVISHNHSYENNIIKL